MTGEIVIGDEVVSTIELHGDDRCDRCRRFNLRCIVLKYPKSGFKTRQGAEENEAKDMNGEACARCSGGHYPCRYHGAYEYPRPAEEDNDEDSDSVMEDAEDGEDVEGSGEEGSDEE